MRKDIILLMALAGLAVVYRVFFAHTPAPWPALLPEEESAMAALEQELEGVEWAEPDGLESLPKELP